MERLQKSHIIKDLDEKMVFVTGPRQVGKTTLAKSLESEWPALSYLNYDAESDRRIILKQTWDRSAPLIVLDEVHKLKRWKTRLKGIYDTEGIPPRILVTGSARLDVYRRAGDSLAGRYFHHRLHPLSVRELRGQATPQQLLEQLIQFGGFPEPFLKQSATYAARWRKQHLDRVLREDVQDLEPVRDLQTLLLLIDLLRERVGAPISMANLARDLEVSPHTVKRWIQILENMYVIFVVSPYHRNIARAILKEPKIYFYDTGAVLGDAGARLENLIAVSLLKNLHFLEDTQGKTTRLHYLRDKEKREIDFAVVIDRQLDVLLEVKNAHTELTRAMRYYVPRLQPAHAMHLVMHPAKRQTVNGVQVVAAAEWLDQLAI